MNYNKRNRINKEELSAFLAKCGPETKVYLGCDSERYKKHGKFYADYILAVVVHIDGSKGAKVFGEVQTEEDVDRQLNRPFNRMMGEVYRVAQLYQELKEVLYDFEVCIHLDINPNEDHGSNVAYQAAVGYIKGTCNVVPFAKPDAFAASYAADRFKEVVG